MKAPEVKLLMHLERSTYRRLKCVGIVGELTQKYRPDNSPDCHLSALYLVDDIPYCKRHAGDFLLRTLTKRDK